MTGHPEICPDINPAGCATINVAPEWHQVTTAFSEVRLHVAFSLTDWLAADAAWSLRAVVVRFQLEDLATRQPLAPPFGEEIHHRNETLVGLTDPWLSLRAGKRLGRWSLLLRAGVTLPLGDTVPNPFQLGRAGKTHEHIQFGSGTLDPLVEVQLRHAWRHVALSASLLGKTSLYANPHGYQAGSLLVGGAQVTSDLGTRRWSFSVGAVVHHEQPERWAGVQETEGNLGRTDLLLDTSIAVTLPRAFTLALAARVPLASATRGEQLATPAILELSVARPFDLLGR